MNDATQDKRRRGDERLLLTCLLVEEARAEHVPASIRLESALGSAETRSLVVALARRLIACTQAGEAAAGREVVAA